MIGKSKNPRCFKHINRDNLPLHYSNQANAWVKAEIFTEWFPTAEFGAMFQLLDEVIEEDEIENWLGCDQQDMGYAHLNDDEIVSRVTREMEEPMQQDPHDNDAEEEEISKISLSAAVTMFEGCIQWLQEQEESNVYISATRIEGTGSKEASWFTETEKNNCIISLTIEYVILSFIHLLNMLFHINIKLQDC